MEEIPVVIAKFLLKEDSDTVDIYEKFKYMVNSLDGDSYYLTELLVEDGYLTEREGDALCHYISNKMDAKELFEIYKVLMS